VSFSANEADDRAAIADLYARYCWALSVHDWDAIDALVLPDARIDATAFGGPCLAWPEFKAFLADFMSDAQSFYTPTGLVVDFASGAADAKAGFVANLSFSTPDGGRLEISEGGWFLDSLTKTGDGWRVAG